MCVNPEMCINRERISNAQIAGNTTKITRALSLYLQRRHCVHLLPENGDKRVVFGRRALPFGCDVQRH
jgi:hypothetical protein